MPPNKVSFYKSRNLATDKQVFKYILKSANKWSGQGIEIQKWLHNNVTFTAPHLPPCNKTGKYQKSLVTSEKLRVVTARKPAVPTLHSVNRL